MIIISFKILFLFISSSVIPDTSSPTSSDCGSITSQGPFYTATLADNTAVVSWIEPTWTDDSGVAPTITKSPNLDPGATLDVGTITITYTATDGASNSETCSMDLVIEGVFINCSKSCTFVVILRFN